MPRTLSLKYVQRLEVHWDSILLAFLAKTARSRMILPSGEISETVRDEGFWRTVFEGAVLPEKWGLHPITAYGAAYFFAPRACLGKGAQPL